MLHSRLLAVYKGPYKLVTSWSLMNLIVRKWRYSYWALLIFILGPDSTSSNSHQNVFNSYKWEHTILQMNSQLLLWSWKVADCSLVDNLIAKKLILLSSCLRENSQQFSMRAHNVHMAMDSCWFCATLLLHTSNNGQWEQYGCMLAHVHIRNRWLVVTHMYIYG